MEKKQSETILFCSFVLPPVPVFLPSVIFSFLTQNKGAPPSPGPSPRSAIVNTNEKKKPCHLSNLNRVSGEWKDPANLPEFDRPVYSFSNQVFWHSKNYGEENSQYFSMFVCNFFTAKRNQSRNAGLDGNYRGQNLL